MDSLDYFPKYFEMARMLSEVTISICYYTDNLYYDNFLDELMWLLVAFKGIWIEPMYLLRNCCIVLINVYVNFKFAYR